MTLKNGAFAFLLKVMRKRKGVTLRQIASTAKFSVSYLSLIENGLRVPSILNTKYGLRPV